MKARNSLVLASAIFLTTATGITALNSFAGAQTDQKEKVKGDPISGSWNAVFSTEDTTVPAKFALKLAGEKVTGTVESDYTGAGKITNGTWTDQRLTLTLEFTAHPTVAVKGTLDKGKLSGEFATDGRVGKWTAELAGGAGNDKGGK
jgi:hypothetical protein